MMARPSVIRVFLSFLSGGAVFFVVGIASLWLLAPEWRSVPGALLHMTAQSVPRPIEVRATPLPPTPIPAGQPAQPGEAPTPTAVSPIVAETPAPTNDAGGTLLPAHRFNILLLGSDNDLKFPTTAVLTQSMIIVSIDPATHEVSMVSIPRDFWVPIAGFGNAKIDVAYEVGGVALARSTVEHLFGIRIDYYAWVGLSGLVKVIDSLGGVDVTVLHPVLDEMYPDDLTGPDPYAYFRLYLPAGPQHLDGTTALEYVRSRHGDLQSDFGRSVRQQQVLVAIKTLATEPSVVGRSPQLVAALQDSVKTDLSLPQIVQLGALSRSIHPQNIQRQILAAPTYAHVDVSPDHQEQIVIPDWEAIRPVMATLLHRHSPGVSDTLVEQARQEGAAIQVLNGTMEDGIAGQMGSNLAWQGFKVAGTGTADRHDYARSTVIIHDKTKPATAQALVTLLHATIVDQPSPTSSAAITVIVGRDHPAVAGLYGS